MKNQELHIRMIGIYQTALNEGRMDEGLIGGTLRLGWRGIKAAGRGVKKAWQSDIGRSARLKATELAGRVPGAGGVVTAMDKIKAARAKMKNYAAQGHGQVFRAGAEKSGLQKDIDTQRTQAGHMAGAGVEGGDQPSRINKLTGKPLSSTMLAIMNRRKAREAANLAAQKKAHGLGPKAAYTDPALDKGLTASHQPSLYSKRMLKIMSEKAIFLTPGEQSSETTAIQRSSGGRGNVRGGKWGRRTTERYNIAQRQRTPAQRSAIARKYARRTDPVI